MKPTFPLAILSVFLFTAFVSAQDWTKHRQTVSEHPELVRFFLFDDTTAESKSVKNLAPKSDADKTEASYRTNHPFEIVDGPFPGSKAVRLDAGWFESPKWSGVDRAFTVEMRLKKTGQGVERGNAGSPNGTLWGLGNGWDNGIRLTTSYPQRNLTFSIGRATDEKSRNLNGRGSVSDGVWTHIASVWDGRTMRIYVDGLLYGILDYDGKLTDPCWGFRIGFNNAGVGSVAMDVAEVALYQTALTPEEILQHALLQPKFPEGHAAFYRRAIDAVFRKDYAAASKEIDALLELKMPDVYRWNFRRFQADIATLAGSPARAQKITAELLADPKLPPEMTGVLIRSLITSDYHAPLPVAPSVFYRKLLDDPAVELDEKQRFAVEKCFAEMLFVEGNFEEAEKLVAGLFEQEQKLLQKDLEPLGVSSEFSDLHQGYIDYLYSKNKDEIRSLRHKIEMFRNAGPEASRQFIQFHTEKVLASAVKYYVAPDGKAENPGTLEEPFGTIQQARDVIRKQKKIGQIVVFVRGGVYPVTETFVLEKQDSGVIWHAHANETPVFTGGVMIKDFKPVDDPAILKRLPEEAKGKVFVAAVPDNVSFPPIAPRGYGKNGLGAAPFTELFIDDRPQQISRWPNVAKPDAPDPLKASEEAFVKTGKVHRGFFNTKDSGLPGIFEYADPRHERWTEAKDAMLFGYWGHLWGITSCRVERIDAEKKQVILATSNPYGYRKNMPYYAFNLLEEIDEPGEWYLDRESKKLYVYPPNGVDLNKSKVRLPAFAKNFFELKNASNVAFIGLTFEEGAGNAGLVQGCENVHVIGCRFDRFGNWGLGIDGKNVVVQSCDFTALGGGGINVRGGDVKTLSPGNNVIENCTVHDFSRVDRAYAPAVLIDGVGNRLAHNLFCDSPGHAIRVEGMEHTIEFNEVHSIVYESDDQSGIDIWGNPYIRGMVFRYNYWHHIGSGRDVAGQAGIRLDDMISSVLIYGNVFFRSSGGHFGGVQIHGGKDTVVDGNLMIDCKYAVSFSPWGEKRWLEMLDGHFGKNSRNRGFDPDSEIYRTKYPDFAELKLNADRNFVTRNVAVGCDAFARNNRRNVLLGNVMLPWMPELFTETKGMAKSGNGRVPSDARRIRSRISIPEESPVYRLSGVTPLPVDLMGPYVDGARKEIPRFPVTPYFVME